jgi:SAM-dependent methyltransferase
MRKEYEALKRPLPLWHPKGIWYALVRALLSGPGNLSDGIRIGNRYGFDSGVMLDYVYKNRASGRGWIGRLIDRVYLNSVGWRGIRNRKALTRDAIARELRGLLKDKEHIDYLDIACGGAEYDLEAIAATDPERIRSELRDYRRENLDRARENAEALGLGGIVFRQADAFDGGNYPERSRDLIVSSGFWEIVEEDEPVRRCLHDCARALRPGGRLLFTIQPDHPQLELIARTLRSHTGHPWVMRLRSLELFDSWLREAGLEYLDHAMEPCGIFGVVTARKV